MEYKRCTRCVMDNKSDHTISFMPDGTCNYCNDTLKRMPQEYFPGPEGILKLEHIFNTIKKAGKNKKYDCVVGVSGGVDSAYVIYLGYKYGLKMLAVHIDDGLDSDLAKQNIERLCRKANVDLELIHPNTEQYKDLLLSFFKAAVPSVAIPQDNIIFKSILNVSKKYNIKYSLSGANFSMESILERSSGVNACDSVHIYDIHHKFGTTGIDKLNIITLEERYLGHLIRPTKVIKPLNYIDYNFERTLNALGDFCDYQYYGGKHYESILCRFLQCWYLPNKYNLDKRKSHLSSLIVSGQITRNEALKRLEQPLYPNEELLEYDFNYLASYFGITRGEFDKIISLPPKQHRDYKISVLEQLGPFARRMRKVLD